MKKMKKGLENKMKMRLVILMLVFVMTVGIIAGCSSGATTKDTQKTESSTTSSEKVTLRIITWQPKYTPIYDVIIDEYKKDNPNVEISFEYTDGPGTLYTSVTLGMQSGDAPDLFTSHGGKKTNLEGWVKTGSVLPLDGKLNLDGYPQIAIDFATVDGILYMSPAALQW